MRVLLLSGGISPEREVSLLSGENVAAALRELGHEVIAYDPTEGLDGILPLLPRVDIAFPALHGKGGEDGTIQQYLEEVHLPYVGAGVEASQNCFNKVCAKQLLTENGLPTPKSAVVDAASFMNHPLTQAAYVLKPIEGGSSIDTFIIREPARQSPSFTVFDAYGEMLLEELIVGRELSVAILGNEALPVTEIIPPEGKEFDYENKYNGKTQEVCPPLHIPPDIQEQAQNLAEQAHFFLGVRHFSRVDMMMSSHGELFILEVNTLPGLAPVSIFPKAAAAQGLPMTEVVAQLLAMANSSTAQS